jgi:hypothetical protein
MFYICVRVLNPWVCMQNCMQRIDGRKDKILKSSNFIFSHKVLVYVNFPVRNLENFMCVRDWNILFRRILTVMYACISRQKFWRILYVSTEIKRADVNINYPLLLVGLSYSEKF